MTTEPTYVPLLRRIVDAEGNADVYLSAWAAATPREDVRRVIATVALREAEHAKAFQRRLADLGHRAEVEPLEATAGRTAIAADPTLSDREKFERLGIGQPTAPGAPDRYVDYFDDHTIDVATGELLGRFISEERDSVRMLAGCYAALCAEGGGAAPGGLDARLDRVEAQLAQVLAALDRRDAVVAEADFRAGLRADGFDDEIRITSYEPGAEPRELHDHPFSARLLVLEGEFVLHYEDGPQVIPAGRCCEVPAGTRHAEAAGLAGARVLAGLDHG